MANVKMIRIVNGKEAESTAEISQAIDDGYIPMGFSTAFHPQSGELVGSVLLIKTSRPIKITTDDVADTAKIIANKKLTQ